MDYEKICNLSCHKPSCRSGARLVKLDDWVTCNEILGMRQNAVTFRPQCLHDGVLGLADAFRSKICVVCHRGPPQVRLHL